jgi:REP element-mobilizing transposase RayT
MQHIIPLEYGKFYHIYNRGVNGENLFRSADNYRYFMKLYAKHVEPFAETFAWCLLKNHFHLLVRIKTAHEMLESASCQKLPASPSKPFSNVFNAYAQALNKRCNRTGTLFERPFERKWVDSERYFQTLVCYIHANPVHHQFVKHLHDYPWTSYHTILSRKATKLKREEVLRWFQNRENFEYCHRQKQDFEAIKNYIIE